MASGSVYSPPTRPLPRNTLSRSAFKFKKSSKYCSWKCTALCAVGVSVLLAILLSYFIGEFLCFITVIINRDVRECPILTFMCSKAFGNSKNHNNDFMKTDSFEIIKNVSTLKAFCDATAVELTSKKYLNCN